MSEPRFIVRESSGYRINLRSGGNARTARPVIEVLVLDRAYCHRVVWSSETTAMERVYRYRRTEKGKEHLWNTKRHWRRGHQWNIEKRRKYARDLAKRLNDDDAS